MSYQLRAMSCAKVGINYELAKKEKITKTAQILVGNFMGNDYSKSKLYDKTFSHEFRKGIKE